MDFQVGDSVTNLLQKFLDVQSRRSEVIASNIANADTPNYAAKELDFDAFLKEAAEQSELPMSRQNETSTNRMQIVEQNSAAVGLDGNTVDSGKEMADLAQVGSNFNFGAKMLQSRLRLLRTAIREGK